MVTKIPTGDNDDDNIEVAKVKEINHRENNVLNLFQGPSSRLYLTELRKIYIEKISALFRKVH